MTRLNPLLPSQWEKYPPEAGDEGPFQLAGLPPKEERPSPVSLREPPSPVGTGEEELRLAGLHVVSDGRMNGDELVAKLVAAGESGARAIHLRAPELDGRTLYNLATRLRAALPQGVLLFVNERVDVALATGADGVQLPARGLPPADVRRIAPNLLIGKSIHAVAEIDEAADFFVLGTIYESRSHPGRAGAGPALIAAARAATAKPIIAIGGITPDRAADVLAAGANGVAAISAVLDAADVRAAAADFARRLGGVS